MGSSKKDKEIAQRLAVDIGLPLQDLALFATLQTILDYTILACSLLFGRALSLVVLVVAPVSSI
jgi:hypothetical protein